MKKFLYIIFGLICTSALNSCINDSGDDKYTTEPNALKINSYKLYNNMGTFGYSFKLGQPIEIPAEFKMLTADSVAIKEALSYKWLLANEVVSTEKVLHLKDLSTGNYSGYLEITDNLHNQKYGTQFKFSVKPKYAEGFYFASEKDNASDISYLSLSKEGEGAKEVYKHDFSANIFSSANEGKKLEPGILDMNVHLYKHEDVALDVIQPGEEGPIDIHINDMQVIGKANKDFIGKPKGKIIDEIYSETTKFVYAFDNQGGVYSRTESQVTEYDNQGHATGEKIVPHASYYPSSPIVIEGDSKITKWVNNSEYAHGFVGFSTVIAYDELHKGIVTISNLKINRVSDDYFTDPSDPYKKGDPGFDGTNKYPDSPFPSPADLTGYKVLSMNAGGYDLDMFGGGATSVLMVLERESDGKRFFLTFSYTYDQWSQSTSLNLDRFFPIPESVGFDPKISKICNALGPSDNFVYFTGNEGRNIYHFNLLSGSINKVYENDSKISCIDIGEGGSMMGPNLYHDLVAIGTDSGDIKVLQINQQSWVSGKSKEVCSIKTDVGAIKFVCYCNTQYSAM